MHDAEEHELFVGQNVMTSVLAVGTRLAARLGQSSAHAAELMQQEVALSFPTVHAQPLTRLVPPPLSAPHAEHPAYSVFLFVREAIGAALTPPPPRDATVFETGALYRRGRRAAITEAGANPQRPAPVIPKLKTEGAPPSTPADAPGPNPPTPSTVTVPGNVPHWTDPSQPCDLPLDAIAPEFLLRLSPPELRRVYIAAKAALLPATGAQTRDALSDAAQLAWGRMHASVMSSMRRYQEETGRAFLRYSAEACRRYLAVLYALVDADDGKLAELAREEPAIIACLCDVAVDSALALVAAPGCEVLPGVRETLTKEFLDACLDKKPIPLPLPVAKLPLASDAQPALASPKSESAQPTESATTPAPAAAAPAAVAAAVSADPDAPASFETPAGTPVVEPQPPSAAAAVPAATDSAMDGDSSIAAPETGNAARDS
jgi:hypothetical protein